MKRLILYLVPVIIRLIGTAAFFSDGQRSTPAKETQPARSSMVAAPGRVEPVSEEIAVSPEIGGRLAQVLVDDGTHVRKGATLAVIENSE